MPHTPRSSVKPRGPRSNSGMRSIGAMVYTPAAMAAAHVDVARRCSPRRTDLRKVLMRSVCGWAAVPCGSSGHCSANSGLSIGCNSVLHNSQPRALRDQGQSSSTSTIAPSKRSSEYRRSRCFPHESGHSIASLPSASDTRTRPLPMESTPSKISELRASDSLVIIRTETSPSSRWRTLRTTADSALATGWLSDRHGGIGSVDSASEMRIRPHGKPVTNSRIALTSTS